MTLPKFASLRKSRRVHWARAAMRPDCDVQESQILSTLIFGGGAKDLGFIEKQLGVCTAIRHPRGRREVGH